MHARRDNSPYWSTHSRYHAVMRWEMAMMPMRWPLGRRHQGRLGHPDDGYVQRLLQRLQAWIAKGRDEQGIVFAKPLTGDGGHGVRP